MRIIIISLRGDFKVVVEGEDESAQNMVKVAKNLMKQKKLWEPQAQAHVTLEQS